mgnify:CR=1 FL=1
MDPLHLWVSSNTAQLPEQWHYTKPTQLNGGDGFQNSALIQDQS